MLVAEVARFTFSNSDSAPVPKCFGSGSEVFSNLRIWLLFKFRLTLTQPKLSNVFTSEMTFIKTPQTPTAAENKKWLRVRFYKTFWLRLRFRKLVESCRCRLRFRGHLWLINCPCAFGSGETLQIWTGGWGSNNGIVCCFRNVRCTFSCKRSVITLINQSQKLRDRVVANLVSSDWQHLVRALMTRVLSYKYMGQRMPVR